MRLSYVLPDPVSYRRWDEFDGDLECMKRAGYDAVELQIADPAQFDEQRVRRSLCAVGYTMCAFQTGSTYATRGNCLCATNESVRRRTIDLLHSFVDLAARWRGDCPSFRVSENGTVPLGAQPVVVFGSLQGRLSDEPDRLAGAARILDALCEVGQHATQQGVTLAFEPVQHGEVGFHNTIAEVAAVVRGLNLSGVRMMVDTFHMNIEERDMLLPLAGIRDILAHVHLSETNRDVLGSAHWPTAAFLAELERQDYIGYCSVGVYNTRRARRDCIVQCMDVLKGCLPADGGPANRAGEP
jgi:5-keto-L-gluconate epimerase